MRFLQYGGKKGIDPAEKKPLSTHAICTLLRGIELVVRCASLQIFRGENCAQPAGASTHFT
jgi:hypothetical protein